MKEPKEVVYAHCTPWGVHDANVSKGEAERWLLTAVERRQGRRTVVYREDVERWTIDGTHLYTTEGVLIAI